jgi:hypothetical protein
VSESPRSVYRMLLGDRIDRMQPELSDYVDGVKRGDAGIGRGEYSVVAGVTRKMEDTMLAGRDGLLHDFLGRRRFLEVSLRLGVSAEGWLRMRSVGTWVWLGRMRVPVPRILSAQVDLTERWDAESASQRVDVTLTHPVLGRDFEYRGSFVYEPRGGPLDDVDTTRIERRF